MEADSGQAYRDEIQRLKDELFEANSVIDAIRNGEIDALVLSREGSQQLYALETADYTYRILIEKSGEGALSISNEGLILYCNDYFARLAGLPASQIVGSMIGDYVDDPETFAALIGGVSEGPAKAELVLNLSGRKVTAYVSLTDLSPHVEAIGIVVTDLTEKKKNETALEESRLALEKKVDELNVTNANLEQFIHVISHDIKEPIRKILTYTNHLAEDRTHLFDETDLRQMNVINTSAMRLNSLVDDLVKYAFSAARADQEPVDLSKVLSEVLDDLEIIVRERGAIVNIGALPTIMASRVQMRQLFSNLISNAIKYARKDVPPVVSVVSEVHKDPELPFDSGYKISVSDNGIGMQSAHLDKIFTIFRRLHQRNEYSGNGIGLAICRKIMENHGGRIDVRSVPGQGSIFNLYFQKHP